MKSAVKSAVKGTTTSKRADGNLRVIPSDLNAQRRTSVLEQPAVDQKYEVLSMSAQPGDARRSSKKASVLAEGLPDFKDWSTNL